MDREKVTLRVSLSPRDARFLPYLLPHQLKMWHDQVDEVLLVYDRHGYESDAYDKDTAKVIALISQNLSHYPKIRLLEVDYSPAAKKEISAAYFNNKRVPDKTHRYGPFYSYFYGLYHAAHDYVFHIDSDIFFGGADPNWVREAIELLKTEPDVFTCSPFPGPPTADGRLLDQPGTADSSSLRKVYFNSFSTRLFLINKVSFKNRICPLPVKIARWPLLYRALLRSRPVFELPEDTITDIMRKKGLKRVDFLGMGAGIWSLHPPFRNEEFFQKLPSLIQCIETGNVPDAQRGYYDINDSMVNWADAREEIKQASLKRRLLKKFGIRSA
ncbi:hypothetical protein ACFS5N_13355 [Mucilaginibacter ximonensis]|uniref:Glycosyl transferase family 2 n=1 Tax=Mucilaginibacter ximonensis TaxID=538021 RepID=A0ABW5YF81_9SPHI